MKAVVRPPLPRPAHLLPLWLAVTAATVLALGLLIAFVGVLRDHIRHADEVKRVFGQPAPHAASARARPSRALQTAAATLPSR